ncbi:MAG: response regulator [Calothrix sp. C42_A2020_038]|nr:response regulator [Calothrix sp. C42_A2020_038]
MITQQYSNIIIFNGSVENYSIYWQFLLEESKYNYQVRIAKSIEATLELCRQAKPDCILFDVLPSISLETILNFQAQVSKLYSFLPPIIIITNEDEVATQTYQGACNDIVNLVHLSKDNSPDTIRFVIRCVIENSELRKQLQASQECFHTSVENIFDCFGVYSVIRDEFGQIQDFRIDYLNAAAMASNRMSKEDFGKELCKLLPGCYESGLFANFCQVVETGEPLVKESLVYTNFFGQELQTRTYNLRASKFGDGFVACWQDITERKQVLEALQESRESYRHVVETVPNIVWRTSNDGKTNFVNNRWVEYTGFECEYAMEMGWLQFIHPDDVARVQAFWQSHFHTEPRYEIQYRLKHVNGTYRWNLVRGYPILDEQGRITRWYGSCTDIHDQKELEAQRNQLLKEAQAAREEAEMANRTKDEFLAIVSHELRSPLNAILGWTKLLRTREFDQANTTRALETIERNAKAQVQLIEDLLDISRMIRGNLCLTLQPVNLATIVETTVNSLHFAVEAKQIELQTKIGTTCQVLGDINRLQQIVSNLLTNAIKFTPVGGRIEISLEASSQNARIIVADTGKGISPELLPYIFERFRQAENTTTRAKDGLGLGLAIVRHLVEMHGGSVTASSLGEGQGATFTVVLPLENARVIKQDEQEEISSLSFSTILENKKVLVVDDELDNCTYLTYLLEESGAIVKAAISTQEALAVFRDFQPDVIISDIGMPEEDGNTLIQKVRQLTQESKKIPAIALTAFARPEDKLRSLSAGFQLHITKPVEPSELIAAITSLIETSI